MQTTLTENILDVTLLAPKQKHPTIFSRYDELAEGESLTLHNDHDPKPLYYQLLGERGNTFIWEYLEQGPEWWRVKISKRITGKNEETLGQIAAKDLHKAEVFKKYGLDFCCGGKKTVKEACAEKGLDVTKVEQELQQTAKSSSQRSLPFNDWPLDFLADYIVNTHHSYVLKNLPDIRAYAVKVVQVHGDKHPELIPIGKLIEDVNAELVAHMIKEEKVLFPFIKELAHAMDNSTQPANREHIDTVQSPVRMMEMEHEVVAENMKKIRELSNNYALPEDACTTYSLLYRMLDEFEEDLHVHVHLENNILFPKAIAIEKKISV